MRTKRLLLIAVLLVTSMLLASCINMQQEYWFNADGSGKLSMDVGMSESLMNMAEVSGGTNIPTEEELKQDFIGGNEALVKNVEARSYTQDGYVHYVVSADVPDMQKFFKDSQSSSEGFAMTLEKLPNGNLAFKQSVDMNSALGSGTGLDTSGADMSSMVGSMLDGQYWTVKVHVPNVVHTNGTWNKSGGYVEWKVPMKEMFGSQAYEMSLEYSAKTSILGTILKIALFLLIALVVVVAAAVGVFFVLKRRSTPPAPMTPPPSEPAV